ncbi:SPOR domain-containing protein [Janthinobacterium lividum]|jgi:cell division protein FtsN|uniref:SPOR domain-containing protein n=1 Tax=Janthinobacterium lividum TaxID=29581 RepID=A0AAJ4T6I0_9BURK|nr:MULTISPECIES: SPOR domain-containing protein [Janthinobacterium]KAB0331083.1 SPOR domain-containing protein [Janthinobacterium lividum]KHA77006.1 cell division protein [Janthinobacterium lividum]MCC7700120.1 SPOR domain-containing protein [Janthinobacterium sp. EB271-G4-7A]MCC7716002.1 SPOR domain-containing protein [Janthinobacterium lividum]MDQ4629572.1 SPOR domain-containing protein [Janthinobacterium lividum]
MNHASRFSSTRRQQGNTLVGIIIGLVIGLGIAVVVALVITKGASPFTDKSGKAGKSTEPTAGQIADPNKPMYGNKEAAKEAARDFSKEPREIVTPTQPAAPAPAQQPKAPPPDALQELIGTLKDKPAPKTPAAAPAAPAPQAKADAKEAKADAASDKWIYYLQAGAFHDMSDAESTRGKLALLGFEAAISDRSTDAGVLHRVRIGPFNQLEAMNRARTKLSENGIDVAVVRNQK